MAERDISAALLEWYDRAHRTLPWRIPPGSQARADPYRVWLSEIMLQQTTVAAVIPYFEAFVRRWPNVEALAAANDGDVMAAWAGLGYYARARNLLACARVLASDLGGRFPDTEAGLRELPGIGAYTAAAIAAIAFQRSTVVVDGNVERVVARLFAVDEPLPGAKSKLRDFAAELSPAARPGDHAQAMMDLGATICRPKIPVCCHCPLAADCDARRMGTADTLPRRTPKPVRPVRHANVYCLFAGGDLFVERRPKTGLLGGMLALPASPFTPEPAAPGNYAKAPVPAKWRTTPAGVRHVFTHFELRMTVLFAEWGENDRPDGEWVNSSELTYSGLPTVFRKAADVAVRAVNAG